MKKKNKLEELQDLRDFNLIKGQKEIDEYFFGIWKKKERKKKKRKPKTEEELFD